VNGPPKHFRSLNSKKGEEPVGGQNGPKNHSKTINANKEEGKTKTDKNIAEDAPFYNYRVQ